MAYALSLGLPLLVLQLQLLPCCWCRCAATGAILCQVVGPPDLSRTYLAHHELENVFYYYCCYCYWYYYFYFVLNIFIPEMVVMQVPGLARSSDLSRMR